MKVISIGRFECREVQELSDAFVDNELLIETNVQVLRHIHRCRDCRALIEEKSRLKRLVRSSVSGLAPPGELHRNIHALIRAMR